MRKVLLLGALLWAQTAAAFLVSSDDEYFVAQDGAYSYFYSKEYSPFVGQLLEQNRVFTQLYETEFLWRLDDPPYLVLASPRNQITNGFATIFPTIHTVFYGGGAAAVDEFASASWLYVLLAHETAHLYQVSAKQGWSRRLKSVLGNSFPPFPLMILPPFPYMIAPNIFAPNFLTEGNATFNESRFGNGGRLYNGAYRSILLNLLAEERMTAKRLLNDHLEWPYGQEKYIVGGYFNLFLAEKYGIDAMNGFFMKNAAHYINPLQLDRSFKDAFGRGYEDSVKDFVAHWRPATRKMRRLKKSKTIGHSIAHGGFHRSKQKVYFLTSDGKTRPRLYQVNVKGGYEAEKLNLPFGKPFLINGDVYVSTSQLYSANDIRFGLYGEGMKPLPQYLDKVIYDLNDKYAAYADVPSSFVETNLYVNGEHFGPVQSSALLNNKGEPVYFKQNGEIRELYIGRKKVAEYQGYFGKVVDVRANGDVYFIANTEYGASLFRARGGKFTRLLDADTIADAKFINNRAVVVAEITPTGYEYSIVAVNEATGPEERPAHYKYFIDQHEAKSFYAQNKLKDPAPAPASRPYSMLSSMKFDSIEPIILGFSNSDFVAGLQTGFSDPLQFHQLVLSYMHNTGDTHDAAITYANRRYLLNFDIGVSFDQSAVFASDNVTVLERYNTWEGTAGISYPLYRRGQIGADFRLRYRYTYEDSEPLYDNDIDREQALLTEFTWQRAVGFSQAFDVNSYQSIQIGHEIAGEAEKFRDPRHHYVAQVQFIEDLFWENFLSAGYHAVKSDARFGDLEIVETLPGMAGGRSTVVTRYTPDTIREYVEVHKVSAGLKQAINWGIYFQHLPIAIRRFAPFGIYQEFYAARDRGDKMETLFHEWAYGLEIEFLLAHKIPFRFVANKAEMNKREGSTFSALMHFSNNF